MPDIMASHLTSCFSHPLKNVKSQSDSDGWNESFTICSYCIISYSMFPSFFVFFSFPSLLSTHIHPFIVAQHWLGSSSSRPHSPPQEKTFLFSVSPAYFTKDFLSPDHLVTKPRSLEVSFDIFIFTDYYMGLTSDLRYVWLLTYTLWALYSIGKFNLKFNQQDYVGFFNPVSPRK